MLVLDIYITKFNRSFCFSEFDAKYGIRFNENPPMLILPPFALILDLRDTHFWHFMGMFNSSYSHSFSDSVNKMMINPMSIFATFALFLIKLSIFKLIVI